MDSLSRPGCTPCRAALCLFFLLLVMRLAARPVGRTARSCCTLLVNLLECKTSFSSFTKPTISHLKIENMRKHLSLMINENYVLKQPVFALKDPLKLYINSSSSTPIGLVNE
ncbi:hypothetical protein ACOSQ4_019850 [Xanthoceras sorbifolium]